MLTIAVLHLKGGSGKTTLAINLAAAAHLGGQRTQIIDMDPLATAFDWSAQRPEGSRLDGITVWQATKPLARDRFIEMSSGYDVVLLDGPAHRRDIALRAAIFADVVLLPVTPGPADFWSISDILGVVDEADQFRADDGRRPVRRAFVVNRAVSGQLLTADAERGIAALGAELIGSVRLRVAFPASLARGESVLTIPGATSAATDIGRLWRALQRGSNDTQPRKAKSQGRAKASPRSHRQARGERDAPAR